MGATTRCLLAPSSWWSSLDRVLAGVMLGARFNVEFIAMLILGCAVMAFIVLAVERRVPEQVNAISAAATELARA